VYIKFIRTALFVAIGLTGGCATTADITNNPLLNGVLHQCFATTHDALLLSRACSSNVVTNYCDTVIELPAVGYPQTLSDYATDKAYWDQRIKTLASSNYQMNATYRHQAEQVADNNIKVYGALPIDTQLEIVQVTKTTSLQEPAYFTYATIHGGTFDARTVRMPPARGFPGTSWITGTDGSATVVRTSPEYLTACTLAD